VRQTASEITASKIGESNFTTVNKILGTVFLFTAS